MARTLRLLPMLTELLGSKVGRESYAPAMTALGLQHGWRNIEKSWQLLERDTITVDGQVRESKRIHTDFKRSNFSCSTLQDGTRIIQIVLPASAKHTLENIGEK